MVNFSLEGKVALVTGGVYGIGFAIAKALHEAGAKIVYNCSTQKSMDLGVANYREAGIDAKGYLCDVTDEAAVKAMVADIEQTVGTVDILVNNAGIIRRIPMTDMEAADFRRVVDVDLVAPFICAKAVIPGMIKKGHGKIINICSMMSELGRETVSAYAAAKGGLKTLIIADRTAHRFQSYYKDMDGISIPQPFCAGFVPFAWAINKGLDKVPGMNRLEIDAEGMKRKFGLLGEPLFLGVIVGVGIGCLTCQSLEELADKVPYILGLGIKMGAVMELIPRVTVLFIEGLKPISEATRNLIARRFGNAAGLNIGMSPALVIGHPTTLVVSLLLIPVTLALAVLLPGNQFLPLASLAGMFYVFPLVLPFTRGNVVKTFIIGLVVLTLGLYMVTNLAPAFTLAANDVHKATGDGAVAIPEGFARGGSLDFASSPLAWVIYQAVHNLTWIGSGLLVLATMALMWWNRVLILRSQNNQKTENI